MRADSPWCTLCYADLRPAPAPVAAAEAPAPSPEPSYAGPVAGPSVSVRDADFDPLTAPLAVLEAAMSTQHGAASMFAPAYEAPAAADPTQAERVGGTLVGWPCTRCETIVPIDDISCPTCGSSFLAEARGEPDLVARLARGGVSKGTQAMIIGTGSVGFIVVVMALLYVASLFR